MPRYIDAEQLKHIVNERKYNARNKHFFFDCIVECDTADVAPVHHAKWIPVTNIRGGHKCSLCNNYAPSFKTGDEWPTDYCPNCGAKMNEEGE